ncbi:MAG TPA: VWA domain-containing protein [Blastocatellia bacterium]|jgi:Ca-activated chloride channel family protein
MPSIRSRSLHLLSLALVGFMFVTTAAQQNPQRNRDDDPPIKLESTLVQVPVTVKNMRGAYAIDLHQKDFALYEDGVRQEIEFFKTVNEPFSVALMIDSSGSTADKLEQIRGAARAFINLLRDADRAMIVEFNDSVRTVCELTGDKARLLASLEDIKAGEYTQVYDAVYTVVWEKFEKVEGRKAAIVFTDGIDNASTEISEDDTLDAVVEMEDVIIYPIRYNTRHDTMLKVAKKYKPDIAANALDAETYLPEDVRRDFDHAYRKADSYLQQLAELSGGVVEYADRLSDLRGALERIATELRQQYLLGYYPTNTNKNQTSRRIKVSVLHDGYRVRARPAYTLSK